MARKRTILIYYSHKETLGHTTRVAAIAGALAKDHDRSINLHILQGGAPQPYIRFPGPARVIDLPHPFDTRASFKGIREMRYVAERARCILENTRRILPDIFVTEFFPFGRLNYMPELMPTLQYLRRRNVSIYASIGYPLLINLVNLKEAKFRDMLGRLISLYDKVLIHTPPGLEEPYVAKTITSPELRQLYRQFFDTIKNKIVHTGYVMPGAILKNTRPLPPAAAPCQHTVIVSRGGGAVYPKVILNAIRAQAILGDAYRFIIACGPATSPEEQKLFDLYLKQHGTDHVVLSDHIPDFGELLATCDVSISLGGYNTTVQLMRAGTRAIIIPHHIKNAPVATTDQLARARLMAKHFKSIIIPYEDLTPARLARAVTRQCQASRPAPAPAAWFCGAMTSANILMKSNPDKS